MKDPRIYVYVEREKEREKLIEKSAKLSDGPKMNTSKH